MSQANWYDPLIMPGIFTVFGLLVWWMGSMAEQKGKPGSWKWVGVVLLVIGAGFGYTHFQQQTGSSPEDVLYRASLPINRRFAGANYLAFFLPLVGILVCVAWHFLAGNVVPDEAPVAE